MIRFFLPGVAIALAVLCSIACAQAPVYDPKDPRSIIAAVEHEMGGKEKLQALKDVQFTYEYDQVSEGKKDISTERYIFASEFSRGDYSVHEKSVAPNVEGEVIQIWTGKQAQVSINGELTDDPEHLNTAAFLRRANYFWFTMFFKLQDPGVLYELLPQEVVDGTRYDVVKITYDPAVVGKQVNDAYILYVNPATRTVDQFLFSLPAFGVQEPVLLFTVKYTRLNGVTVPLERRMYPPTPNGRASEPALIQKMLNIQFNNGFSQEELTLES